MMRPKLPPKRGYVEAIINGERVYRNTRTGAILRPGEPEPKDENDNAEVEALRAELASLYTAIERGLSL